MTIKTTWVLKYNDNGSVRREEYTDRIALDERVAVLVTHGCVCVVVPIRDEGKMRVVGATGDYSGLILGPARGARFLHIQPRMRMPRK